MQQPKQEIEAKIIAAGRTEFLNKGYAKATVRAIAGRAGI
ncbi:MAG: TetR family transcriptional regulator, partial [Desulfobacteraceae bacterium]